MSNEIVEWMESHVASLSCVTCGLRVRWRLVTVDGREIYAMSMAEAVRRAMEAELLDADALPR